MHDIGYRVWAVAAACMLVAACSTTPTSPSQVDPGTPMSHGPLVSLLPQTLPPVAPRIAGPTPTSLGATRFLAFGDSITWGTLSWYDASFVYDAGPWAYPARLKVALDTYHAGPAGQTPRTYAVVNAGVPSEAAREGALRIQSVLTQFTPQALLLLEGINDLAGGTTPEQTVNHLSTIVNTARANNVTVLIATMPQTYDTCKPPPLENECRDNAKDAVVPFNNRIIATFSGRQNVHIVDLYTPFGTNHVYMGGDGLHPTEAGYELMATTFLRRIEQVFAISGSFQ